MFPGKYARFISACQHSLNFSLSTWRCPCTFLLRYTPGVPRNGAASPFLVGPAFFTSSRVAKVPVYVLSVSCSFNVRALLVLLPLVRYYTVSVSPVCFAWSVSCGFRVGWDLLGAYLNPC